MSSQHYSAKHLRRLKLNATKTNSTEKVITVGVGLKSDAIVEIKESLLELDELVHAAGGEVVGNTMQILEKYNAATLIGTGKVDEVLEIIETTSAELVVVDHLLSGAQLRNLENKWEVKVLDRSQLILDIFAQRAQTYEGKLQVELAQMMDQLPRMVGGWLGSLSRLGGGIGTRGPGEKALEIDRRIAREKMKIIKKKLEVVRKNRKQNRSRRKKNNTPSFAIIGYTNAGKSTLINQLARSNVLTKDQVFATLDPTTKKIFLQNVGEVVITDTVGFIRNLPTQLIEAFKATLEESAESDVLIHVIDLSSPQMQNQIDVVNKLINEFNWGEKPIIHVFNKLDKADLKKQFSVKSHPRVFTNASTGEGMDELKALMVDSLDTITQEVELYLPKEQPELIFELGRESKVITKEETPNGIIVKTHLKPSQIGKWKEYYS